MDLDSASAFGSTSAALPMNKASPEKHVVDRLIEERAARLSSHPLWPLMRPALYRMLHYHQAVRMADAIAALSGHDAMQHISDLLSLDVTVTGLANLPRTGGFVMAPNHPTGIADGVAVFDVVKTVRADLAVFANRDALRVAPRFRELIIPVEWRPGEKSRAKSRDTLEETARAFQARRPVVLFPSGRIAYWNAGKLTERPWQSSAVALARRYDVPIVPVNITARNSGLFYFLSKYSTELRDMTVFHELLNKKGRAFAMTIGRPIPAAVLDGDAAEVTARLHDHALIALAHDPDAVFISVEAVCPAPFLLRDPIGWSTR